MAPPPVCHALVLPFQVSLPGSPGAGMVKVRQSNFPVAGSSPATQSRTPLYLRAEGFGIPRDEMLDGDRPVEMTLITDWCWRVCESGDLAEAIAAKERWAS